MGQCMVHQLMPGFPCPSPVFYRAVNATPCCVSLPWFELLVLLSLLRFYSKLCYCPQKKFLGDDSRIFGCRTLSKIFSEKAAGNLHCLAVGDAVSRMINRDPVVWLQCHVISWLCKRRNRL